MLPSGSELTFDRDRFDGPLPDATPHFGISDCVEN